MKIWNDVLKLNCSYEQNGVVKDNYNWEGFVIAEHAFNSSKNGTVFSLEGITVDNQVTSEKVVEIVTGNSYVEKFKDKRYLFANSGLDQSKGLIRFVIFSKHNSPIDYEFMYDREDNCFYGVYYFTNSEVINVNYNGYAKLVIDQEIDMTTSQINSEISTWEYFNQNGSMISSMDEFNRSNLQVHDTTNNDRFMKAKEFFNTKKNFNQLTKLK